MLCEFRSRIRYSPRPPIGQWHGRHLIRNRNSDGNLYVRYLYWNGDRWDWNNNWLDNDWNGNNPAAVPATRLTSHPASWRGRVL